MQAKDSRPPVVIVADAGVAYRPERSTDPISDWVSLMEVMEALCPRWPEREPSMGARFLL